MDRKEQIRAKELLSKYKEGTCTHQETLLIERWFHAYHTDHSASLSDERLAEIDRQIYDKLHRDLFPPVKKSIPWRAIAASLFLVASFSIWIYMSRQQSSVGPAIVSNQVADIAPGKDAAVLILDDGRRVELGDSLSQGTIVEMDYQIKGTNNGQLEYDLIHPSPNLASSNRFNTIVTPRAGEYSVVLPDGSKVWLNAASSIRFPLYFGRTREVYVEGEAYFEVQHDRSKPFKVHVGHQLVEVLGTHFNVRSYREERSTSTVLVSGSVKVSTAGKQAVHHILKAGDMAISNGSDQIDVLQVNPLKYKAWKDGDFFFDGESLQEIMDIVARWYDVKVIYPDTPLDRKQYGGIISKKKNLSEVLKVLENKGGVRFQIQGKEVTVIK